MSDRPMPSSFDENEDFRNESGFSKVMAKVKREPLIPLGGALTVAALVSAFRANRRGDHNQVQRMFRARVLAQGFTIVAMVVGGIYFNAERHKERELWKLQQAAKDEDKKQRWIKELEVRDQEDKDLKEVMDRRRARAEKREREGKVGEVQEQVNKLKENAQGDVARAVGSVSKEVEGVVEGAEKKAKEQAKGWGWFGGNKPAEQVVDKAKEVADQVNKK